MNVRDKYPLLAEATENPDLPHSTEATQALQEIQTLRAMAWTLGQLVPAHWWKSPPNQATADVLEGIIAIADEAERDS